MIELSKLWLFDNRLSDRGAACVAALLHPGLLEIHLSHNAITTAGVTSCAHVRVISTFNAQFVQSHGQASVFDTDGSSDVL